MKNAYSAFLASVKDRLGLNSGSGVGAHSPDSSQITWLGHDLTALEAAETLRTEISRVLEGWLEERFLIGKLVPAATALAKALETQGFIAVGEMEDRHETSLGFGSFLARISGLWRHPDCTVPFRVDVICELRYSKVKMGVVQFGIELSDSGLEPGVLAGKQLCQRLDLHSNLYSNLHSSGVDIDFKAWYSAMERAFEALTPERVAPAVTAALAQLDAMTTP